MRLVVRCVRVEKLFGDKNDYVRFADPAWRVCEIKAGKELNQTDRQRFRQADRRHVRNVGLGSGVLRC